MASIDQDGRKQQFDEEKLGLIRECLSQEPVSLWDLRELALSKGGLLNAEMRKKAWLLLVGISTAQSPQLLLQMDSVASNISEKDRGLMSLDSGRASFSKFDFDLIDNDDNDKGALSSNATGEQALLQILESTMEVKPRYGTMQYYQGLHDVAGVLLYNLGDADVATGVLRQLCASHFREALRDDNFASLLSFLQSYFLPLLHKLDAELHDVLSGEEVMLPAIIFPWIITWFTHDLCDPRISSRLVDALLCGHSTFTIYLAMALLIRNREEIISCALEYEDEPMMVATTLKTFSSKIVSDYNDSGEQSGIPAQHLIDDALSYMEEVLPREIPRVAANYHGVESISMQGVSSFYFRAAPSWAVASFPDHTITALPINRQQPTKSDRAKIASGLATHRIRPRRHRSKERSSSGKDDASSVASSACSTKSRRSRKSPRRGLYRNWWHQSY